MDHVAAGTTFYLRMSSAPVNHLPLRSIISRSGQSSPAPVDHSSPASSRQPPIDAQPPTVRAAPILAHRPHRHSSHIVCPPPRRWTPSHRTLLTAVSTAVRPHRWIARLPRALVLLGVGGAKTSSSVSLSLCLMYYLRSHSNCWYCLILRRRRGVGPESDWHQFAFHENVLTLLL